MNATTSQRPLGITILAALAILGGISLILGGLGFMGIGFVSSSAEVSAINWVGGGTSLVLGLFQLVFGIGLWRLQPWAWMLGVVVEVLAIANGVWAGIRGESWVNVGLTALIPVIILLYLFSSGVKAAFGR